MDETITPPTPSKPRTVLFIVLGLALVLVLAGAAFVAGRLMNRQAAQTGPNMIVGGPGGPGEFSVSGSGGASGAALSEGAVSMELNMKPAAELPTTEPEVNGLFVRREDNSLFLGTGQITMGVTAGEGGAVSDFQSSYDGPVVEVVVTNETKIYLDTTQLDPSGPAEGEVEQTVALSTLDDINKDSSVVVWGRRTGDRVVAEVILFMQPMIITMPEQ